MKPIDNPDVAAVFEAYPARIWKRLLRLRQLIFDTASQTYGVGELEETLKWGQPAYVTAQSGSGTTIRIDRAGDSEYAMFFHCRTSLVETFRTMFPDELRFEGNRNIVLRNSDEVPIEALRVCVEMALTYHRGKRGRGGS